MLLKMCLNQELPKNLKYFLDYPNPDYKIEMNKSIQNFCMPSIEAVTKGINATVMAYGQTGTGKTKLIAACEANDTAAARSLLSSKASPDAATKDGQTPLFIASQNGQVEIVRLLCDAGADKEQAAHGGASPSFIASQSGHVEIVRDPGSFATVTVADAPIVIVRDRDGALRAFYNVCKHRAHELLSGRGTTKAELRAALCWIVGLCAPCLWCVTRIPPE